MANKEFYFQDKIVDKQQQEHTFIVCGVAVKGQGIGLGISITNPLDIHNPELGKTIAKGRALKKPIATYYVTPKYPLTDNVLKDLVMNAVDDVMSYPDAFIGGINKKKSKVLDEFG